MRSIICVTAALAFCACSGQAAAKAKPAAKPAAFQINETTWTFVDKKDGKLKESIDADGNYIAQTVGGKHIDHGTVVMKDGKACFTSAMTKDGEMCWAGSPKPVKVGHSFVSTSDKGEKLKVTRVAYVKMSMPK